MKALKLTTLYAATAFATVSHTDTAASFDLSVARMPPPSVLFNNQVTGLCANASATSVQNFIAGDYSEFKDLTAQQSVDKIILIVSSNPWGIKGKTMENAVEAYVSSHKDFLKDANLYCVIPQEISKAGQSCTGALANANKEEIERIIKSLTDEININGDCTPGFGGGVSDMSETKTAPGKTGRLPAARKTFFSQGLCTPSTSPTTPNPC